MSIKAILQELVSWRTQRTQRQRIAARPLDKEHPDPTPMAIPVGYEHPPTMTDLIQRYVRLEVSQAAEADGLGSFEEEDDYSVESHDPLPMERFEVNEYSMEEDPDMPATDDAAPPEPDPSTGHIPPADAAPAAPAPPGAPTSEATTPPVSPK